MIQSSAQQPVEVEVEWPLPRTVMVRPDGELDVAATEALGQVLEQQLDRSAPCRLLLDLSRVERLSTPALSLLLRLRRRCRLRGVHLVLVGSGRPPVNQPLRIAGLLPLFDSRPSVESATRGLASNR